MTLSEFDMNYKHFLDKSTLLFGETGTGKSFIMTDILYHLRPHVDQIIVISPMDRQNHTYDKGIVPLPCIHYTITNELLNDIWDRQNALSAVCAKANNPNILRSLFDKIPDNSRANMTIESIHKKLSTYKDEIKEQNLDENNARAKIAEMESDCDKLLTLIWKQSIDMNHDILCKMNLSKDEQYSLKYLNLNPRIVLVLDDCTDLLKKFKSHPVIQKLFYQGRWANITSIISCHTDKALDPELKKNAYISIFTEESSARAFFERKSNDLDKEARGRAFAACKESFTPLSRHQKLIWIRLEKKFYKFTATNRLNFRFGSPYIWEYCNKIKTDSGNLTPNNKFITGFM